MMGALTTYQFPDLPTFSKKEVVVINQLVRSLSLEPISQLAKSVQQVTKNLLEKEITVELNNITWGQPSNEAASVANASVNIHLYASSLSLPILLSVERLLAYQIVYSLLGGHPPSGSNERTFTPIEQGILEFYAARIMTQINEQLKKNTFALALADTPSGESHFLWGPSKVNWIDFDVKLETVTGKATLFFPAQSTEKDLFFDASSKPLAINRVAHVSLPLIVQAGKAQLSEKDLASLERDDIIVLESPKLHLKEVGLTGTLLCQIGDEDIGNVWGSVFLTKSGRYGISVSNIAMVPSPKVEESFMTKDVAPEQATAAEQDFSEDKTIVSEPENESTDQVEPQDASKEPATPPSVETLSAIKTPLCIELGRINMTLLEIAKLQAGSIIELSRKPSEPVDLIVSGKSIGKGELVDIEGELGVKILSIVK